jgi:hypothetical protein
MTGRAEPGTFTPSNSTRTGRELARIAWKIWQLEVITMRVLPVIRLSSLDEATTSPGRQLDQITRAARAKEPDVVILDPVYDLDVSGAVSPFARSGLGPWLTDPDKMLAAYGAREVPERVDVAASDSTTRLAEVTILTANLRTFEALREALCG